MGPDRDSLRFDNTTFDAQDRASNQIAGDFKAEGEHLALEQLFHGGDASRPLPVVIDRQHLAADRLPRVGGEEHHEARSSP